MRSSPPCAARASDQAPANDFSISGRGPVTIREPFASGSRKAGSRKLLLVASTGGHLAQLARFAQSLGAGPDSLWVTFDTPQSRSLLSGQRVLHVPYVKPRDWRGAIAANRSIASHLRLEHDFDSAYSTGAALAVSALPLARRWGIPSNYIESVSRVQGPSLSGRILAATGMADMYTQHDTWATAKWRSHPSVLAEFATVERPRAAHPRLFVSLGTIQKYRFDALLDAVLRTGLADHNTVWQVGETTGRTDLPGTVYEQVSSDDFNRFAQSADTVISHAGVGSLLGLLELGIHPLLVTRKPERGEHVDNHQSQIADLVNKLGIATAVDVPELTADVVKAVSGLGVQPVRHEEDAR